MLKDRQKQNFENAFINKSNLQINAIPTEIPMASSRKLKKKILPNSYGKQKTQIVKVCLAERMMMKVSMYQS